MQPLSRQRTVTDTRMRHGLSELQVFRPLLVTGYRSKNFVSSSMLRIQTNSRYLDLSDAGFNET